MIVNKKLYYKISFFNLTNNKVFKSYTIFQHVIFFSKCNLKKHVIWYKRKIKKKEIKNYISSFNYKYN